MGIRLQNKVPENRKKLEEYKPYKRELKSFLIEHTFFIHWKNFLCLAVMVL